MSARLAARVILYPVLASRLPVKAKLGFYKTYICFRLTYAALVLYGSLCLAKKNFALRVIVGAGRHVMNDVIARDLRMESIQESMVRLARRPSEESSFSPRPIPQKLLQVTTR